MRRRCGASTSSSRRRRRRTMSSRRSSTCSRGRSEWARRRRRESPSRGREPRRSRCIMAQDAQADLKESVLRALSTVTDPELDEPITELGFVKNLSVSEDGRVSVDLVTSTFWCSPNFVYMMLEEARDVVSKLSGVHEVRVHLDGHHDSDRINEAINSGKSFSDCYGAEANGNLAELNRMIRTRALRSRLFSVATPLSKPRLSH